ncbi:MAG: nitrite reductase [Magnetococcales bacterium]|nr:nitrite reductase [Magnetococcales bacterium]
MSTALQKTTKIMALVLLAGYGFWWLMPEMTERYLGLSNPTLTYDSDHALSEGEFEALANQLVVEEMQKNLPINLEEDNEAVAKNKIARLAATRSHQAKSGYRHIAHFRKAGIRQYKGPSTCLTCHDTMAVEHGGKVTQVKTLQDVVESVHFKFQQTASGFTTFGYDGREINHEKDRPIPMGKIDRACGIPGTFSWIGWAALIDSKPEEAKGRTVVRSEGCGQCHIGGNTHPASEMMMPGMQVPKQALEGIDCLICHAAKYDMNYRTVIQAEGGTRWNQDRTLLAAMTVGQPTRENCLLCHQHNMGGDTYQGNVAAANLGYENRRILHEGAKRANPFSPEGDVHAAVGMTCTDCHVPQGHKIPRGTQGTDLVANDLPGKPVRCEGCHSSAPHVKGEDRVLMNGHSAKVACEACHIHQLQETSIILRDWLHPVWDAKEGIYVPYDLYLSGKAGQGMIFLWFNGNGTFLANALGDNPTGGGTYDPFMTLMAQLQDEEVVAEVREQAEKLRQHYPNLNVDDYVKTATQPLRQLSAEQLQERRKVIDEKLRPLMQQGSSRLQPFKIFNALMFEDLNNQGPFGGMILPFDYATYYQEGNPQKAVVTALQTSIMKRMYELPFKKYMMDDFMAYFGVGRWQATLPLEGDRLNKVEPRWMRQMGTLMVNHGIQKEGRGCKQCHAKRGGILRWEELGYSQEKIQKLRNLKELQ